MSEEIENHRTPSSTPQRIRSAVRREGAEKYLLYTLLSFAGSVSVTRLFLQLTGYPQVGNKELHIAHVLWGGLLLYIATIIPLLYANRWVFTFSSVISGIGIGLFIDEVGKFITQTNDYFYPPAAPIIYSLFLVTVLLYYRIKRNRVRNVRSELYAVLDGLEEVLDHDLSQTEKRNLGKQLDILSSESDSPDVIQLAESLKAFVNSETLVLVAEPPKVWDPMIARLKRWEKRWIGPNRLQGFLAGGLFAMAIWSLNNPILTVYRASAHTMQFNLFLADLIQNRIIRGPATLGWFEARLALEFSVGLILMFSSIFLLVGNQRRAIFWGNLGLLLSLTTVNLLRFYFDQFSTIITASIQFSLFLLLTYYRGKYLPTSTR
jgi:hypothetical protein